MARLSTEEKDRRTQARRLKEALAAEAEAVRRDDRRRVWDERKMYLTRDEAMSGAPCRGCGLPVIDGRGSWPALLHLTQTQRVEYETADAAYKDKHARCRAHRWSMDGSRAIHCGYCCPPLPMSDEKARELRLLLQSFGRPDPEDLSTWRLILTCGHGMDRQQHRSNPS
jgi:hypothetical protein